MEHVTTETVARVSPPALIYIGMGLVIARILLENRNLRGLTWLQWLQFLVDAARITLLWPLVLFIERLQSWLKSGVEGAQKNDHA